MVWYGMVWQTHEMRRNDMGVLCSSARAQCTGSAAPYGPASQPARGACKSPNASHKVRVVRETATSSNENIKTPNLLLLPLHKLQRLILTHDNNAAALIPQIPHAIALLRDEQHLGSKRGADELPAARLAGTLRDGFEHVGDGGAVLRVEVGVDFVKEVERGRVALLDREDEGEGAETCLFYGC